MATDATVAVFSTHVAPALGYGGVSVTASVLTKAWAEKGRKIFFCASNESVGGALKAQDVQLGNSVEIQLYRCYWFRRWGFGLGAMPKIWSSCWRTELVYIHGIATWPSTLAAVFSVLMRRRFVIAPRGGLMPEHVALIRRRKPHKWLYYKLLTIPTLRRANAIHCTSETEAEGVKAVLPVAPRLAIIPNGVNVAETRVSPLPTSSGLTLCFLGHLQREKGINAFIRAWLRCRRPGDRLLVAGRGRPGDYLTEFERLVASSPGAVTYCGYLDRAGVLDVLARSHFLVLPSGLEEAGGMRENFGNVVAEALAAGRPVLVTKGLAWDHLEKLGAGLLFERSADSVCHALRRAQAKSIAEWRTMTTRARKHAECALDARTLAERAWELLARNP